MSTRMLRVALTSTCLMFAMLSAVGMCDSHWPYTHSSLPAPSPETSAGDGGSAAANLIAHLITTTVLEPLAFLIPLYLFLCY
ncbi:hypothetical protein I3843_04G031400 [Carya illinoinensis]|nr:hypothetical protein I3760_04G031500 [Carya illinoinensis]KAG7982072.1 hypothetical protein I3843_04G031400 [Carya illinoinensis]